MRRWDESYHWFLVAGAAERDGDPRQRRRGNLPPSLRIPAGPTILDDGRQGAKAIHRYIDSLIQCRCDAE